MPRGFPQRLALAGLLSGVVFVAAAAVPAQRADRSRPPASGPVATLRLPTIETRSLRNGLAVWTVEQHEVPVAEVLLVLRAGAWADPTGKLGLASLTAAMLDEGAGDRDALALADAIDYLGADLSTSSSFDASTVRLHVPSARLAEALPLMADVVLRPRFPAEEFERIRSERLTALLQSRDQASQVASFGFSRILYGEVHRYGTPDLGTTDAIKALGVDDLRDFHRTYYRPELAAILLVGDVQPDQALGLIEQVFADWPAGAVPMTTIGQAEAARERRVYIIDKPGAAQSEIRIGAVGVARTTPDYFVLQVLNTILGGAFSSRLNQNLREEHGYTYGAGSGFTMRLGAGPFVAAAAVQTDKTAPALVEFFKELEGMHEPVPAEELERAKNYLALRFPNQFETTRQIAGELAALFTYQLDESQLRNYVQRIQAVTADEVRSAAEKYIQSNRFAVVIVGDRQAIERDVRALKLGPVTTMTVAELMGPV